MKKHIIVYSTDLPTEDLQIAALDALNSSNEFDVTEGVISMDDLDYHIELRGEMVGEPFDDDDHDEVVANTELELELEQAKELKKFMVDNQIDFIFVKKEEEKESK